MEQTTEDRDPSESESDGELEEDPFTHALQNKIRKNDNMMKGIVQTQTSDAYDAVISKTIREMARKPKRKRDAN